MLAGGDICAKAGKKHLFKKRWSLGRAISKREGQRKRKYGYVFGRTYEEVEQKLIAVKAEAQAPKSLSSFLFENVSLEWLDVHKPQLKISSYAKYANLLNSYLLPSFGIMPIQSITRNIAMKYSRE